MLIDSLSATAGIQYITIAEPGSRNQCGHEAGRCLRNFPRLEESDLASDFGKGLEGLLHILPLQSG
jgi:hypothetical protein